MTSPFGSEEAYLLRQLLNDAHRQIRELQAQVEQLSAALLVATLNDRRRATGFRAEGSGARERRRESAVPFPPEIDRRRMSRRADPSAGRE